MPGQLPSPPDGHIIIGQVVGPHGIKGGLRATLFTEFAELFDPGEKMWLDGNHWTVKSSSFHKDQVRVHFRELTDRNIAETYKWMILTIPEEELPEYGEDVYRTSDLVGLKAIDLEGKEIGTIEDVVPSPAHDQLVIRGSLIPAIKEFVKEIDLDAGTITLDLIPGLLEDE
ncbi:MAG: 16S rRNA processing protein RimM [Armatimonadetes bacterium]|nr:16S rRNA processing protein RimM [Armatimonadota bacterium]